MLPKQNTNIYPRSKENIIALNKYYFDRHDRLSTDKIFEIIENKPTLTLNQIEFIFRKLSEGFEEVFASNLNGPIDLSNLFNYAIDAIEYLDKNMNPINGSGERIRITKEFSQFIKDSEIN